MNQIELKNIGLSELKADEAQETSGGCGWYGWCLDRWTWEVGKATEAFVQAIDRGYHAFDIHD